MLRETQLWESNCILLTLLVKQAGVEKVTALNCEKLEFGQLPIGRQGGKRQLASFLSIKLRLGPSFIIQFGPKGIFKRNLKIYQEVDFVLIYYIKGIICANKISTLFYSIEGNVIIKYLFIYYFPPIYPEQGHHMSIMTSFTVKAFNGCISFSIPPRKVNPSFQYILSCMYYI